MGQKPITKHTVTNQILQPKDFEVRHEVQSHIETDVRRNQIIKPRLIKKLWQKEPSEPDLQLSKHRRPEYSNDEVSQTNDNMVEYERTPHTNHLESFKASQDSQQISAAIEELEMANAHLG